MTDDRRWEVRALVERLDSYAKAARQLGLTRERVRQIAGNGLTTWANKSQERTCADCGRTYSGLPDDDGLPRCPRCRRYVREHGVQWSPTTVADNRKRELCKHGHPLTDDNIYSSHLKSGKVVRRCKRCVRDNASRYYATPEERAKIQARNKRYYDEQRADPVKWQRYMARINKSRQRRSERNQS